MIRKPGLFLKHPGFCHKKQGFCENREIIGVDDNDLPVNSVYLRADFSEVGTKKSDDCYLGPN